MARFPDTHAFTGILKPLRFEGDLLDLVILEAQAIEAGPIARIKLAFRLSQGLHGNWADVRMLSKN